MAAPIVLLLWTVVWLHDEVFVSYNAALFYISICFHCYVVAEQLPSPNGN